MLSFIVQLRFFLENPSVADAKMAISFTPAFSADYIPF
jgi:hypothetical protein